MNEDLNFYDEYEYEYEDEDPYEGEDGYDFEDDESLDDIFGEDISDSESESSSVSVALPSAFDKKESETKNVLKEEVDKNGNTTVYYSEDDDDDYGLGDYDSGLPNVPTNGNGLTYEEQMEDIAEKVFGTILSGKDNWKKKLDIFKGNMPEELFTEENFLIAKLLNRSIRNKIMSSNKIKIALLGQLDTFKNYDNKSITLSSYPEINGNKENGLIQATVSKYEKYINSTENISEEDLENELMAYKTLYKQVKSLDIFQKAIEIQTTGIGTGQRRLIGPDDATLYVKKEMAKLSGLMESQDGRGFTNLKDVLTQMDAEDELGSENTLICDWGPIPTLNKETGGIRRGNFYQILAGPKNGKSKFCASRGHSALINGKNISVWAVEGGTNMWTAQLRCIHCNYYHNKDKTAANRIDGLPSQQDILNRTMDDTMKSLEKISKEDLFSNPNYGSLDFIDRPFNLETFIDEIDTSVSANNSELVIIDYIQLITSLNPRKASHEVIANAYIRLLQYCKKKNIAILSPVQFKQETINELRKNSKNDVIDLRTSAAGSQEVLKTPDWNGCLWANTQDLMSGRAILKSMPNRFSRAIPDIELAIDLKYSIFAEVTKD